MRSQTSGDHAGGVPPVPISNTEVKTSRAKDTWGASPWQSRSSPGNKRKTISNEVVFLCFMQVILRNESWGSTRSIHIAGVCVTSRNVAKSSSAFRVRIHTAGECVLGRNVANLIHNKGAETFFNITINRVSVP
jgi:hypothetical protein